MLLIQAARRNQDSRVEASDAIRKHLNNAKCRQHTPKMISRLRLIAGQHLLQLLPLLFRRKHSRQLIDHPLHPNLH